MRRATGNLTFHDRELGMAHHGPFTSTLADNVIICLWHVQAIYYTVLAGVEKRRMFKKLSTSYSCLRSMSNGNHYALCAQTPPPPGIKSIRFLCVISCLYLRRSKCSFSSRLVSLQFLEEWIALAFLLLEFLILALILLHICHVLTTCQL
jgi:hypothetical protein